MQRARAVRGKRPQNVGRREATGNPRFDDHTGFNRAHDGIDLGRLGKDVGDIDKAALEVPLKLSVVAELTSVTHDFGVGQTRMVCQEHPTAQEVPRTARVDEGAPKVMSERPRRERLLHLLNIA